MDVPAKLILMERDIRQMVIDVEKRGLDRHVELFNIVYGLTENVRRLIDQQESLMGQIEKQAARINQLQETISSMENQHPNREEVEAAIRNAQERIDRRIEDRKIGHDYPGVTHDEVQEAIRQFENEIVRQIRDQRNESGGQRYER